NGLGAYFGGKGWNLFYNPDPVTNGVKVPATKNIFEGSALNLQTSTYQTGQAGRTGKDEHTVQGSKVIRFDSPIPLKLVPGMMVQGPGFFAPVFITAVGGDGKSITVSVPANAPTDNVDQFTVSSVQHFIMGKSGNRYQVDTGNINGNGTFKAG